MVALIVLEPWTQISADEGISGFASSATITVSAMLILSAGISQTGVVQLVGQRISNFVGESLQKQLLATIGVTGPVSGFINNTPVVAILVQSFRMSLTKGRQALRSFSSPFPTHRSLAECSLLSERRRTFLRVIPPVDSVRNILLSIPSASSSSPNLESWS